METEAFLAKCCDVLTGLVSAATQPAKGLLTTTQWVFSCTAGLMAKTLRWSLWHRSNYTDFIYRQLWKADLNSEPILPIVQTHKH